MHTHKHRYENTQIYQQSKVALAFSASVRGMHCFCHCNCCCCFYDCFVLSPHQSVASALLLLLLLQLLLLLRPLSTSVRGICTAAAATATAATAATTGAAALPDVGRHIRRRLRVRDVVTGLGLRRGGGIERCVWRRYERRDGRDEME